MPIATGRARAGLRDILVAAGFGFGVGTLVRHSGATPWMTFAVAGIIAATLLGLAQASLP